MLNFLKKLFLSNKYSLLVLLILSLWLKLVKDYNIILSYLVLIALYLVVGILVEMVLEKFFPNFNGSERSVRKPAETQYEAPYKREPEESVAEEPAADAIPERRYSARSVAVRKESGGRELPERRGAADQSGIRDRAKELETDRTPKVTSSYIKAAGSIPHEMEKKLVRTAANFHSIKQSSERLYPGEKTTRRVYENAKNPFVNKEEDLYTNKKSEAAATPAPSAEKAGAEIPQQKAVPEAQHESKDLPPVMRNIDFEPMEDYGTATPDELGKISEDIAKEVERRVAAPRPARRTRVILPDELSETVEEPVRPRRQELYSSSRNNTGGRKDPMENYERKDRDAEEDKVSADMEKIDKLFNRNRANAAEDEEENKTGVWSRFKKKR